MLTQATVNNIYLPKARLIELEEEANLLQGWEAEQKRGKIEGIKNAMKRLVCMYLHHCS